MAGVNKVILIGNLGQDPELRYTQGGAAVCTLRLAVNETWYKDGEKNERTEWVSVVVWGNKAETCNKYLRKGSQVYVEGRLQTREWEDGDGAKRRTTEVAAFGVTFLSGTRRKQQAEPPQNEPDGQGDPDDPDTDLPF